MDKLLSYEYYSFHLSPGPGAQIPYANPHLIWGVAVSSAEIARVQASEIFHAATWSGMCTFGQFSPLGFSAGGFWSVVLETAARAQPGQSQH